MIAQTGHLNHHPGIPRKAHLNQVDLGTISTHAIIALNLLLAVILTVGHHLFLKYIDGDNVAKYNQFWIKNAGNAFSNCVSLSLGMAASSALVQVVQ